MSAYSSAIAIAIHCWCGSSVHCVHMIYSMLLFIRDMATWSHLWEGVSIAWQLQHCLP